MSATPTERGLIRRYGVFSADGTLGIPAKHKLVDTIIREIAGKNFGGGTGGAICSLGTTLGGAEIGATASGVAANSATTDSGFTPGQVLFDGDTTAYVGAPKLSISAITKANPAVVTSALHGLATGDIITIAGVVGMTQVNDRQFTITKVTNSSFSLNSEDSTLYDAYVSGGVVQAWNNSQLAVTLFLFGPYE